MTFSFKEKTIGNGIALLLLKSVVFQLVALEESCTNTDKVVNDKGNYLGSQLVLPGQTVVIQCTIDAQCVTVPSGDPTCYPTLCVLTGRTLIETEILKVIPNDARDATFTINRSPTAARWKVTADTSWTSDHFITITLTIKEFQNFKAGYYLCYDGDSFTSGPDGINNVQLMQSSQMYRFNEFIMDNNVNGNGSLEQKSISFKPGFTGNISCKYVGTPGHFTFHFLKKCPGEKNFTGLPHVEFRSHWNFLAFNETIHYEMQIHSSSISFVMTRDIDQCLVKCDLLEYMSFHRGGTTKLEKLQKRSDTTAVRVEMDYSPVTGIRYTKSHTTVWPFVIISIVNLVLSAILFAIAVWIYKGGKFKRTTANMQRHDLRLSSAPELERSVNLEPRAAITLD